ncbi:uncharacterized protein LOC123720815 [Pieris brassicae]|uniref:Serpin domain-containing protein n=1 Tax=Pieris brassicae TaxID=7116 RepID=A0A9P0TZX9_PIEBR|nr:uncharacterized protein LOC123720815 [Pieris brassicae]CAH4037978.1 unnamed protein product [Pieris brassicae]
MKIVLSLIIYAASVCADDNEERRSKLPYIADAAGISIPRPSNLPATVGSPVNLLTPDRYEFYTFDESGELVKRLMTLEEIQAIVAAGEDADGLVTFANENQPTIAFNFSQPPYTKVNSVVTNVQNVLKAQMEAHKNNPLMQPTLDTPDVSDSWSLILPSIFGNTGVDIVPDKTSGTFITPETETIEDGNLNGDYLYPFSKEANSASFSRPIETSTKISPKLETKSPKTTVAPVTHLMTKPSTVRLETKPVTFKPSTTTVKTTTEKRKVSTTTVKPLASSTAIHKDNISIASSVQKIDTKLEVTTKLPSTKNDVKISTENILNSLLTTRNTVQTTTEKIQKIFVPVSTIPYSIQKTTNESIIQSTKSPSTSIVDFKKPQVTPLIESSSPNKDDEYNKINSTTITTQSVSLSTVPSSTEEITSDKYLQSSPTEQKGDNVVDTEEPTLPMFDFAQSISQIASDLGGNYAPLPTANNIADSSKENNINIMESKENIDIDISQEPEKVIEKQENMTDNYVKVTTLNANQSSEQSINQTNHEQDELNSSENTTFFPEVTKLETTTATDVIETTTFDLILADSMEDLLSQVVYQTNNIVSSQDEVNKYNNTKSDSNTTLTDTYENTNNSTESPIEISTRQFLTENLNKNIDQPTTEEKVTIKEMDVLTTERSYKNDDRPNYLPISSSENKSIPEFLKLYEDNQNKVLSSTLATISESNTLNDSIDTNKYIVSKKQSIETTTALNKIETTTSTLIKDLNSASNENKVNTVIIHKLNKVQNKIYVNLPKADEFKKKIQKINIDDKEFANERNNSWKLIPPVPPPKSQSETNNKYKPEGFYTPESNSNKHISLDVSKENQGLLVTTKDLGEDIIQFVELCNELAFQYWNDMTQNIDKKRSFVFSPYAITSMLAMMFMGARGATSGEMNDILKLDDMVTFNPHFTLRNVSDSIDVSPASGVAVSAFIRELYSDRSKGKILTFYKERAQQFYNGHVEEINFKLISDVIRRRTNLLVKRYTMGRITEYMKTNSIVMQPPLAAFSMNIFETDCTGSSVDGRDGEMYFVVSPNVRQRRLVPVPAVVYRTNFLAGYDPVLDATAATLGNTNSIISTLFLMPGQQGNIVHGEDLETLEKRLLASNPTTSWNRLLRTLLPRVGLELQIPRFSHKSIFNVTSSLRMMGLKDIFNQEHADLGGLNGPSKNLYLSDMVQLSNFVTCGEGIVSEQHHIEEYPETLDEKVQRRRSARWLNWDEPRDYQRAFHDPHDVGEAMHLPLHLRPRQARLPARSQPARLKFDRPFLYFVRHNPSGMILYVGRYNPRLMP